MPSSLALMAGRATTILVAPPMNPRSPTCPFPAGDYIIRIGGWNGDSGTYIMDGTVG